MSRVPRGHEEAKRASVLQLLFRSARLLDERALARVAREGKAPGLRKAHMTLVPHVTFDGIRLTELADKLGVTKQAVSQLVAEMVEMGVLEYASDPTDARAKLVRFTAKGAKAIAEGLAILRAIEDELTRDIGAKKMRGLRDALEAVLAIVEEG